MSEFQKPTIEQVAWVAKCITENKEASFRALIYGVMGYNEAAYVPLCEAGLLKINNAYGDYQEPRE